VPGIRDIAPKDEDANRHKCCAENKHHFSPPWCPLRYIWLWHQSPDLRRERYRTPSHRRLAWGRYRWWNLYGL